MTTPLRILHVTFDMAIGGTEQVIRQLVLNLPEQQICNEIFCIDGKVGAIGQILQQQGVKITQASRKAGLDFNLVRTLRSAIRDGNIDIVHCHQYTPWVYGWFAAWGTKAKVVFTEHGRFYPDRTRWKALPLNIVMAMTTRYITAISAATRQALQRHEFVPAAKIRVIYNGIQQLNVSDEEKRSARQQLGLAEHEKLIGTVARLDSVKNQPMMLKAFSLIAEQYPDVRLLIVGDGPERQKLQLACETYKISERVIFTGFIDKPAALLAVMDMYLLSSFTEGTSMTLLEAMSLGIPCVATAVGGNPEIVSHEHSGLLTASDDAGAFAKAIETLLYDPIKRLGYGDVAYQRFIARFSVQQMITAYLNIYHRACNR